MKKKIILLAFIGVIIASFIAYSMYNKPHRNIAKEKADFEISCNQLFDDFENDEKSANAKYLDKVIEVSGTIIDIAEDQTGKTVLTLEAENSMIGGALCTIIDNELKFIEDQNVTLKCKCTGFLMDVVLTECTLIK